MGALVLSSRWVAAVYAPMSLRYASRSHVASTYPVGGWSQPSAFAPSVGPIWFGFGHDPVEKAVELLLRAAHEELHDFGRVEEQLALLQEVDAIIAPDQR